MSSYQHLPWGFSLTYTDATHRCNAMVKDILGLHEQSDGAELVGVKQRWYNGRLPDVSEGVSSVAGGS